MSWISASLMNSKKSLPNSPNISPVLNPILKFRTATFLLSAGLTELDLLQLMFARAFDKLTDLVNSFRMS